MSTTDGRGDPFLREDHEYFALPDGIRLCDDAATEGAYFLYRDGEVVTRVEDADRVADLVAERFDVRPEVRDDLPPVAGTLALVLPGDSGVEVVEVVRRLRGLSADEAPPWVSYHYALTVQSHAKWTPGMPPRPRPQPLSDLPTGPNLPGAGVRVGVVDTGCDEQPWFVHPPETVGDVSEVLDQDNDQRLDFEAGHGTFITGLVLQHAPGATVAVRRLGDTMGCVDDLAAARIIEELLATGVDVLSLSFGGYTADNTGSLAVSRVVSQALDDNPDLVVVAAAGNDSTDRPFFPAALKRVVAVGALEASGRRASFSNWGSWVDAWTTAVDLDSTFVTWPVDGGQPVLQRPPAPDVDPAALTPNDPFTGWATWSGTSFAAPRVAAAVAAGLSADSRGARRVVFDLVHGSSDRVESGALVQPDRFVS